MCGSAELPTIGWLSDPEHWLSIAEPVALFHRIGWLRHPGIFTQYEFEEWYDQLGGDDSPLADAIIDRIAHDSYRINITSIDAEHDKSMREVYGLDKALRE